MKPRHSSGRSLRAGGSIALLTVLGAGGAACGGEDGGERPATHVVSIRLFEYDPARLEVSAGDTVIWVNEDIVPHTATAPAGAWDTGELAAADSARHVMVAAGEHDYVCTLHPQMRGSLFVRSP